MALNRARLPDAFDRLGQAALSDHHKLDLAVYDGSAFLLASNFRFSTEDVDVADVTVDAPAWLRDEVQSLALENAWADDWLNDAIAVHLSRYASRTADHIEFGSYPRGPGPYGLEVIVPSAEYMLALEAQSDARPRSRTGCTGGGRYRQSHEGGGRSSIFSVVIFPTAQLNRKSRSFFSSEWLSWRTLSMRPNTLRETTERMRAGTPREIAIGEFLDVYYTAPAHARLIMLQAEPPLIGDSRLDALIGAIAEHLAKMYTDGPAPRWVEDDSRFLDQPWFTANAPDPGLCEYLTFSSPAAFKRRNIMTDGAPLRRATTPPRSSTGDCP